MKNMAMLALGAALITTSTAGAQSGSGASSTGSSINSSGTGGAPGAGASSLNTPADNNGGGSSAPAKSAPRPRTAQAPARRQEARSRTLEHPDPAGNSSWASCATGPRHVPAGCACVAAKSAICVWNDRHGRQQGMDESYGLPVPPG
jgi:hypothetical protein